MRNFTVQVTPQTNTKVLVEGLKRKVGNRSFNSEQDTMILEEAVLCICDFSDRAKKDLSKGTTLQASRNFSMSFVNFQVKLNCPNNASYIDKVIYKLRGNI